MNESRYLMSDGAEMSMNQMADALNYWKKPGDTNCHPKPVAGNTSNSNDFTIDRWVQDGSYLRLKDVTVSYSLSQKAVKKMHVKGLRFYVSGLNLYTASDVTANNPEAGISGNVYLRPHPVYYERGGIPPRARYCRRLPSRGQRLQRLRHQRPWRMAGQTL